jgi:proteasome-associated ATPase
MTAHLLSIIERQNEQLLKQDRVLSQLKESRCSLLTVLDTSEPGRPLLGHASGIVQGVNLFALELQQGKPVLCDDEGRILRQVPHPGTGHLATVKKVLDAEFCEVEAEGLTRIALIAGTGAKEGDLAVLDASFYAIIRVVQNFAQHASNVEVPAVSWDQIGGHEEAKQELRLLIEDPIRHPALFKKYGAPQPKGLLLWGAPGCGKTLLGKAAATALAGEEEGWFRSVKGPELLSPYVGMAEQKVRELFQGAAAHKKRTGKPGVIFIDEADALLRKRGSGRSSDVEMTIVPAFLAEMDGVEESGAFVMLATNRPDTLDEAVTRKGRIDRKIEIGRPGFDATREIFGIYFSKAPLQKGEKAETLSDYCAQEVTLNRALEPNLSGALINNIVERAAIVAMRRDIASGGRFTGIGRSDASAAIKEVSAGL